jgi:hypothetical protein
VGFLWSFFDLRISLHQSMGMQYGKLTFVYGAKSCRSENRGYGGRCIRCFIMR